MYNTIRWWLKSVYFWSLVHGFTCQSLHLCVSVWFKKKALPKVKRYWSALCPSLWCSCGGRAEGPSPAETPRRYRVVIHRSVWSVLEESTVTWLVPRSELFVTTNTTEISNHLNCFNPTKEIFFFHTRSTPVDFVINCDFFNFLFCNR